MPKTFTDLDSRIFLTFVTQTELSKLGYDTSSWPLYVSEVHTRPGRLNCKDCGCLAKEPMVSSVVNSKFLFIEFSPEIRESVFLYDKIIVGNSFYTLKASVRCSQAHFTCAILNNDKWLYFDDLRKSVSEYDSIDILQLQFPGGWFFAVFEHAIEIDCIDTISITETSCGVKEQKLSDTHRDSEKVRNNQPKQLSKNCDKSQTKTSAHVSVCKKANSAPQQENGMTGKLSDSSKETERVRNNQPEKMTKDCDKFQNRTSAHAHEKVKQVPHKENGMTGSKIKLDRRKKGGDLTGKCKQSPCSRANNNFSKHDTESNTKRKKTTILLNSHSNKAGTAYLHFLNSVFQKPGIYSCAVDCFLELSRYVFFSHLSSLSARSKFPELLFNTTAQYCEFSKGIKLLSEIREPVWLYLRQHCSSFQARDCNAAFSQIFEAKTFGSLNAEELSLFATQRVFESYCESCEHQITLDSRIFLTFVTQTELSKLGYDTSSWPLYVSEVHTQPGRLNCKDCGCLAKEPMVSSVVNSKFLFIEFSPEIRESVFLYDKIIVGNSFYTLKASVRCSQAHFTCAIQNSGKWLYFDDFKRLVREFKSLDFVQMQFPGGWFFAVFELINEEDKIPKHCKTTTNSHVGKRTVPPENNQENGHQKRPKHDNLCSPPEDVDVKENDYIEEDKISEHCKATTNSHVGKRTVPPGINQENVQQKRPKHDTSYSLPENDEISNQQQDNNMGKYFDLNTKSHYVESTQVHTQGIPLSNDLVHDEADNGHSEEPLNHNTRTQSGELHEQKLPKEMMKKFHKSMKMCIYQCTVCHEAWPRQTKPKQVSKYVCSRCARDKSIPKKFSTENSMIPSPVPKELQGLTQFEEMLIARAFPVMHVYTKPRGGQTAYKGHVITLPQDVQQLADVLPRCPKDLPVIVFTIKGKDNNSRDFTVRRKKVSDALYWLTGVNKNGEPNNHLYQNITIDKDALQALPENGVLSDITKIQCAEDDTTEIGVDVGPTNVDNNERVYNDESEMSSYLPSNVHKRKEKEILHEEFLQQSEKHDWQVGSEPLNEFSVQYLAAMSFPTLFPDGKGDPTNNAILLDTSDSVTEAFANKLKHLIKFGEKINDKWVYRFASHPRFAYWAYNMLYRKRILGQGSYFLKQNPSEANLTLEELKEMLQSNTYSSLMSKLMHYAKNVTGTNAYWNKARDDLKAIINQNGPPTIFWTLSCADFHWPEFHELMNCDS